MKMILALVMVMTLIGCNNDANDGDARTDTTNMPVDSNIYNRSSDHINRADGQVPLDSSRHPDSLRQ